MWHQNTNLNQSQTVPSSKTKKEVESDSETTNNNEEYIQQKFKNGQSRIWNDIQSKICTYLASTKLHNLKYEHFIQILSVVQRLKKVGMEFCGEPSTYLLDSVKEQSLAFFQRYHAASLEEICLFLDNEAWVPVNSFNSVVQLQEFRFVKKSSHRHLLPDVHEPKSVTSTNIQNATATETTAAAASAALVTSKQIHENGDDSMSYHSQDGSSIYGSCGYFYRFAEKSSPFDGGFDEAMLEEDILAGIADESSCYFSEESEEERSDRNHIKQSKDVVGDDDESQITQSAITVCNSSLNVLRCIGRYLQMCRLLHSIAPYIVASMSELIDFYIFAVHDLFGSDLVS